MIQRHKLSRPLLVAAGMLSAITFPLLYNSLSPVAAAPASLNARSTAATTTVAVASPPAVMEHYNFYPISGSTASTLRSQMIQMGPTSQIEGLHYDADTNWVVHWSYDYQRTPTSCRLTSARQTVDVTYTLPHWQPMAGTDRSLVAEWTRYLAALMSHEKGHAQNGISAGANIEQALNALPAYPSCQALHTAVVATVQQVTRQHNQWDIDYDRETQHGLTQGALFRENAVLESRSAQP